MQHNLSLMNLVSVFIISDNYGSDFVAEMDTVDAMRRRLVTRIFRGDYSEQSQDSNSPRQQVQTEPFRKYWSHLITFIKESQTDEDTSLLEFYLFLFLRVLIIFVLIPLWIGLGLMTAGFLWPPQIREWLFVMRESGHKDNNVAIVERRVKSLEGSISNTKSGFLADFKRVSDDHEVVLHTLVEIQKRLDVGIPEIKRLSMEMTLLAKQQNKFMRETESRPGRLSSSSHRVASRSRSESGEDSGSSRARDGHKRSYGRSGRHRLRDIRGDRSD